MKLHKICVFTGVVILSLLRSSEGEESATVAPNFFLPVNACAIVNCGQGTCHTDNTLLGFDCECNSGWKKLQIGDMTLPPCIVPDCTLSFGCGRDPSPPPPPPPPPPPTSFNISDPCSFTWCNDGTCKSNGTSFECDCNPGSDNLLNATNLPCFQECSLGTDCKGLGLGGGGGGGSGATPPPDSNSSPTGQQQSSHGSRESRVAFMIKECWTLLLVPALLLPGLQGR